MWFWGLCVEFFGDWHSQPLLSMCYLNWKLDIERYDEDEKSKKIILQSENGIFFFAVYKKLKIKIKIEF